MWGEKATAIQFSISLSLFFFFLLRRACGNTRRLFSLKSGVILLHTHAFLYRWRPAFAQNGEKMVMEPYHGAQLKHTRNDESKTLNKGL